MRTIISSLLLILSITFSLHAEEIKFQGNAPRQVLVGDKFQIVYVLNAEGSDIRLAEVNDFQILMGPSTSQSSSVQIINGNVSQSVQFAFTYILKATKEGTFTINPAAVSVKGNRIQSNPITIEVVKNQSSNSGAANNQMSESLEPGTSVSEQDVFIRTSVSKTTLYEGESLVATTKIYTRIGLDGISDVKNSDNRDFLTQEISSGGNIDWGYENVNGKTYRVGTFDQKLLIPQKSGKLTLAPTELEFLIRQRVQRQSNNLFDDFFDGGYRTVKKRVKSNAPTVVVKPLPSNKPTDFSGITGNLTIEGTLSKTETKANEGLTYKIVISGNGNHKLAEAPKIKFPGDFESYEPKISTNISNSTSGMKGSKTFEYLIIPRHEGNYTIPTTSFTYFDPQTEQYKTIQTKPFDVRVLKGSENASSTPIVNPMASKEEIKFLGKDIRFIKQNSSPLRPADSYFIGSTGFILLYLLAIACGLGGYWYYRKKEHESVNVHIARKSKANKIATKRLKTAALYLQNKDKERFYDEVLRALWGYLGDKLNIPLSELSKDTASSILLSHGASAEQVNTFMSILDTCEYAKYAPGSGSEEMDKLYQNTLETISSLEGKIK